jgi:hypothetical protein
MGQDGGSCSMLTRVREQEPGEKTADRVRRVLALRGLSLHQVSAISARIYGSDSPSHVPHTLYHSLAESAEFGPSLEQTCALSRITNFRIENWLTVLGIDLERIAEIEAALPLKRTRVIRPACDRICFETSGIAELKETYPFRGAYLTPQLLRGRNGGPHPVVKCGPVFARIGSEDAFAWPELLPGSIVRVVPEPDHAEISPGPGAPPLRLIEHERGLWCGRFHLSADSILYAAAPELAYAQTALRIPQEALIVGVVDMEIRWLHRFPPPTVPEAFSRYRNPAPLNRQLAGVGALLRKSRARAGLTLEGASLLSREVSLHLGHPQYRVAPSTLSEYEAQSEPPRHLEKLVTLCVLYGIRLLDLVAAAGTVLDALGQQVMPQYLMPTRPIRSGLRKLLAASPQATEAGPSLPENVVQVPCFLADWFERNSGIPHLSVRDFYWLSGNQPFLPPHTQGSMLAVVDRRKKKPVRRPGSPPWQQPAWVLIERGGARRYACCSLEGQDLVLYPESDRTRSPEVLRAGRDAEVVGQIVAIARRIPPSQVAPVDDFPSAGIRLGG